MEKTAACLRRVPMPCTIQTVLFSARRVNVGPFFLSLCESRPVGTRVAAAPLAFELSEKPPIALFVDPHHSEDLEVARAQGRRRDRSGRRRRRR
jgi:hypothetical protein